MAWMKIRLFHILLAVCEHFNKFCLQVLPGDVVVSDQFHKIMQERTGIVPRRFHIFFKLNFTVLGSLGKAIVALDPCLWRLFYFIHRQICSLPGCSGLRVSHLRSIGAVYLLPSAEDKKSSSLPLVDQWEDILDFSHRWGVFACRDALDDSSKQSWTPL